MRQPRSPAAAAVLTLVLGIVLSATPAVAQDGAYDAALESGDLTTLVPASFAASEIMSDMPFEPTLGPPQLDTPDAAAAREELLGIIEAAGLTPEDAVTIDGFAASEQAFASFSASRIPGAAAADWFELLYQVALNRNYSDPMRESIAVGPKQVLRISDRGSNRSDLFYAQGEVLWQLSGDGDLGVQFLDGLATIDGPALSADPGALVDGEPVAVIGTADDALSQIPSEIRGATTSTQTFPLAAMLEGIDSSNADDVATADALRTVLDGVGGVDRATIISSQALGDDGGGVYIVGLTVEGADQSDFADGFLDAFLLSEFDDPQLEETQLGGKSVVRISEADSPFAQAAYLYGVGGTAWILRSDEEYIAALLRTMP